MRRTTIVFSIAILFVFIGGFLAWRLIGTSASSTADDDRAAGAFAVPRISDEEVAARLGADGGSFRGFGPWGGGFQGAIAITSAGTVLVGGDVSGVHRSDDAGTTFTTASRGLGSAGLKVAALLAHPEEGGKIYAAAGWQGRTGGLYVSLDDGRSWEVRSTEPRFSGNNNPGNDGLPTPHPRSTGNLIAIDPASGTLWVATFRDGVLRSHDDGETWTYLGLRGTFLRSLALDPDDPDVLYAASYGDGVWKTIDARNEAEFVELPDSPRHAEELAIVDGNLAAAAGPDGVLLSPDGGSSWHRPSGPGLPTGQDTVWTAIAGHGRVLYAGCLDPAKLSGGGYGSVYRSDDGGETWRALTTPDAVHDEIAGSSEPWWVPSSLPSFTLGGRSFVVGQIAIDPNVPERVLVAGRSGVWRTEDGGATWHPAARGLAVTSIERVAADPNQPQRLYAAATDYRLFVVDEATGSMIASSPPGSATAGLDVAVDGEGQPTTVLVATGERDRNRRGEIYASSDPTRPESWTSLGLADAAGGGRPQAIAAGREDGEPVVLAAVEGRGIWRRSGDSWARIEVGARLTGLATRGAQFAWPAGSSTVYLYDNQIGLLVSLDAGRTWELTWSSPVSSGAAKKGIVIVDPSDPSSVLVSVTDTGVFRIRDRQADLVGAFGSPGPIGAGPDGVLFVTEVGDHDRSPRIFRSTDGGRHWVDLSDAAFVSIGNPSDVAVTLAGGVVVATVNNGMLIRG